jgi:hypothetical protein
MSRPAFKPTKEQRLLVRSLAAVGTPHKNIAILVGVRSPKTVRKHFRRELRAGSAEAIAAVSRTALEMAISGKHPLMTEFWLSVMVPIPDPADLIEAEESTDRVLPYSCEMVFDLPPDHPALREVANASQEN